MPLGLSQRDTTNAIDRMEQTPTAVIPPASYGEVLAENVAAPFKGIASGLTSVEQALETGATSAFANLVVRPLQDRAYAAGNLGMPVPESSVVELDPDELQRQQAVHSASVLQGLAPDPRTSGAAAQLLHGLFSAGTRMVGGTLVTGSPFGGAALVGATEGTDTRNHLIAQGVDAGTANELGLGSALFSGAGALLPGGVGKTLMTRMLSGTGIQLTAGIANRTMMHVALEDAGYADQAHQYLPLDGAAMMADAILGASFGAVHHVFAPDAVDAARVIKDAQHVEQSADGVPTSPESRDANVYNVTRGAEALIAGYDLTRDTRDVETVPNPAQEAARATAAKDLDSAAAEVGGEPLEAPALPEAKPRVRVEPGQTAEQAVAGSALGRAARAAEREKATEAEAAKLTPETQEAMDQAQAALADHADLKIQNDAGEMVKASDAVKQALDDIKTAATEGDWHRVAAACFGRA